MSGANRTRVLLAVAVAVVAAAVWTVSAHQRSTADRLFDESRAAAAMLTAMLDQETGLRGYVLTRDRAFLEPFVVGGREFGAAADQARRLAEDGPQAATLDSLIAIATRWRSSAEEEIAALGQGAARLPSPAAARERKRLFDRYRAQDERLQEQLAAERSDELGDAGLVSAIVIVLLAVVFFALGFWLINREVRRARARLARARRYRDTQAEFAGAMQIMRDESEAHALVKSHLERSIEGADVTVLNRNNSDNRLYAATAVDGDAGLAERLVDAEPDSCLAVRLGHAYEQGAGAAPLLECELCGRSAAEVLCTPSLVGGEVIGSVLVRDASPLAADDRQRIAESVTQAAPVLANLRNLAIAEARAATDALTGLPNSRSCRDNLKRMVAHAGRTVQPLSAVLFDLDHFKQVNDRFGHGAGDDVLAAVGSTLEGVLRASDFGGRYGGEEFLLLLPETEHSGALEVCEKLREAISALEFQQPELRVTASFGIAVYPLDALDGDSLVRMADRALYAAKAAGRDRVELVAAGPPDGASD
ncbi:MAG: diguanylate cyclase [Solirubrobacterales bacterium]|nr:diguanylate cyclase [Solirubrobacterales bacterium]